MADSTFADPDVTTFARLDGLGLKVVGQFIEPGRAILECRVVHADQRCRRCGEHGWPRDSTTRWLAHEPLGWRPTLLLVTVRRYRCGGCGHVWRQDTSRAAQPRAKLSRGALRWALEGIVCQHLTVARIADRLGVSWNTANSAVLAEGRRVLIADPHPDRAHGKTSLQNLIDSIRTGVPTALVEIRRLGSTLHRRAQDVLAFFDRPGTSNGPTEAINSHLEHLRGSALGFRNLTNYIARSLLESGGFRRSYTVKCDEPVSVLSVHGNSRASKSLAALYHPAGSLAALLHPALIGAAIRGRVLGYRTGTSRPADLRALVGRSG